MQARIGLWSLLTGRIAISNLRLVDPSLNVVKRGDGVWNFQLLLDSGASSPKDPPPADQFPSIQIRSGRINFKVGDEKSTFYFSDADIDLDPAPDRLEFRFRGEPARTDRAAQVLAASCSEAHGGGKAAGKAHSTWMPNSTGALSTRWSNWRKVTVSACMAWLPLGRTSRVQSRISASRDSFVSMTFTVGT